MDLEKNNLLEPWKVADIQDVVEVEDKTIIRNATHPHLADVLLERLKAKSGQPVIFSEGNFFCYDKEASVWKLMLVDVEMLLALAELNEMKFEAGETITKDGEVKKKYKSIAIGTNSTSILKYAKAKSFDDEFFMSAKKGVQFKNGFLCANTLKLEPSSAELRQRHAFDCNYNPKAKCPLFISALDACFYGDEDAEQKKKLLQEFAGATPVCYLVWGYPRYSSLGHQFRKGLNNCRFTV